MRRIASMFVDYGFEFCVLLFILLCDFYPIMMLGTNTMTYDCACVFAIMCSLGIFAIHYIVLHAKEYWIANLFMNVCLFLFPIWADTLIYRLPDVLSITNGTPLHDLLQTGEVRWMTVLMFVNFGFTFIGFIIYNTFFILRYKPYFRSGDGWWKKNKIKA